MSAKTQVTQVHVLPSFPKDSPGERSGGYRGHRPSSGCPRPGRGAVHRFAQTRGCQCPEWAPGARSGTCQELVRCPLPGSRDKPRCYRVRSSDGSSLYKVDLDARSCECPDSQKGNTCKHRIAAYYVEQANQMNPLKPNPVPASPKPTCTHTQTHPPTTPLAPKPPTTEELLRKTGLRP